MQEKKLFTVENQAIEDGADLTKKNLR